MTHETSPAISPNSPRRLPVITINGRKYYLDERLKELRAEDNPHDRIQLEEVHDTRHAPTVTRRLRLTPPAPRHRKR